MSVSPVWAAVLVLPLQQQLSRGWRLRSSTRPDPAWGRARVLRKVLSSSCLQVLKFLELNVDLQVVSPLPRVLLALLHTLDSSWSWFAEGCDEFLTPGWGLLLSCNSGNRHGYYVFVSLCYPVQQQDFFKKFPFKVGRNPPRLLCLICD